MPTVPTVSLRPLLLLAATTPLLLGGCFSAPERSAAGTETADERISLAMLQPPRSGLSPLSDDAFKLSRWATAETLVVLDESGDAEPGLATAWTQLDPTTWRLTIRPGVQFHDGTELTPERVVDALTAAASASPAPRILDGVDLAAEVDPADPTSVLVRTATADPLLPQRLSSPQLAVLAEAAYRADGTVDPVGHGTGPFELVSIQGTSGPTLDRFEGYWGDTARAAGIDVDFVPDGTARAAALRTGAADVVEAVPVSQAALLDRDTIVEVPMPRTNTLYLNTARGVFADPAQRAAARDAIRRQAVVDTVYEGRADVAQGLLGPAIPWAAEGRPTRSETPAAPAAAEEIVLATFTDRAELPEVAVLLEQQLEAAGFSVRQEIREYAQIEDDALAGTFDAFILSRATVLDSGDPVAYLYSDFSCAGSFNIAQLCDPEIDAALARAATFPTGADRRAAILAAEKLVLETDAAIPMLHERVVQGESGKFDGVERDPRERLLVTGRTAPNSAAS